MDLLQRQLRRDPELFLRDDCARVRIDALHSAASFDAPFIITNVSSSDTTQPLSELLSLRRLRRLYGSKLIKHGDSGSLVANGLGEQPKMLLREALCFQCARNSEFNRITFTTLDDVVSAEDAALVKTAFAAVVAARPLNRFTLTAAGAGHGIGWHFHDESFFLLAQGRKKWYVGAPTASQKSGAATAEDARAGHGLAWPCDLIFRIANRPQYPRRGPPNPSTPHALLRAPALPHFSALTRVRLLSPRAGRTIEQLKHNLDGQRITRSTLRSLEEGDVDAVLRSICRPNAASRSCIQEAGEIMFVPHRWGHEIYNLEPSVGVQAMHTPAWRAGGEKYEL